MKLVGENRFWTEATPPHTYIIIRTTTACVQRGNAKPASDEIILARYIKFTQF